MMNFKQWQVINENYGRIPLGVKSHKSVGVVGSKLAEIGLQPADMSDDLSGDMGMTQVPMDDFGVDDGGVPGLGANDDEVAGSRPGSGVDGKITIDDLDPSLLAALGLDKEMGISSPFGDEQADDGESEGEEEEEEQRPPFGSAEEEEEEEEGNPFAVNKAGEEEGLEAEDDGEEEEEGGERFKTHTQKKKCGSSCDDKKKCSSGDMEYSKKFMGKEMQSNEDASFWNDVIYQGSGNVHPRATRASGNHNVAPKPGEVGYPVKTRIGW